MQTEDEIATIQVHAAICHTQKGQAPSHTYNQACPIESGRDWELYAQEDKDEGEEAMDAEAVERRRMREAEEWRLKQLRSGVSSQDNSNFQVSARLLSCSHDHSL